MSRQALTFALTGQLVEMVPPEREVVAEGAPTAAATYSVWRGDQANDDTPILTGTATLDTVATTLATTDAGASQANRRKITLASTTGIDPRRSYLVANASEQREIVTPFEVASAFVTAENDLAYDYPISTSTFKGLRQTFVIDPTFIANEDNINTGPTREPPYRVRWSYVTAAGTTRHLWTYFDVVRVAVKHTVTGRSIVALFGDLIDMQYREQRGQMFEEQVRAGWDQFVFDLTVLDFDPNQLRDEAVVNHCVRLATLWVLARQGVTPQPRSAENFLLQARDDYKQALAEAFKAPDRPKAYMDTGTQGEIRTPPARPFFVR